LQKVHLVLKDATLAASMKW